jgi:hypothetical protein
VTSAVLEEILDMVLVRVELGAEEIVIPIVSKMVSEVVELAITNKNYMLPSVLTRDHPLVPNFV